MTATQQIESLLQQLPHKLQVRFAYLCCMDIKDKIKDKASLKALALTKAWLDGEAVTKEELKAAANSAANSAHYATYAAYNTAAYYANTAVYASNAAYYAADAYPNPKTKLNEHLLMLKTMIKDMTELEKILYNINDKD